MRERVGERERERRNGKKDDGIVVQCNYIATTARIQQDQQDPRER